MQCVSADGKVQRITEVAALCLCGSSERISIRGDHLKELNMG